MSIHKHIVLKKNTSDVKYTKLCNDLEKQRIFVACGDCDDKWIKVRFVDEIDYLAWCVAHGLCNIKNHG